MIDRKWHKGVQKYHLDANEGTAEHLAKVLEALRPLSD